MLTVFQTAVIPSFGPFSPAQKERLKTAHPRQEVHFFDHLPTPAELAGFDCIIGNPPVSLIKELPDLKLLQLCSAGVDVYVNDPDYSRQVILANASGAYGEIIAEFTIGMHLYLLKQLGQYRDAMAEGRWEMLGQVSQLAGSTVVCLGTGDLGASYAKKAQLLGAHTIGVKRTPAANLPGFDQVATMDQLEEVLPQADALVLSLPDTPETRQILNARTLSCCKDGVLVINIGRGTAIDTEALCQALDAGKVGAAGLDVTDPEPLPQEHRLWKYPNVLITPHVTGGSCNAVSREWIVEIANRNISAFIETGAVPHAIDIERKY